MLHVPALPGSPRNELTFTHIVDWVLKDAVALTAGKVDALLLENFGDAPFYPTRVPPHTVAFMTALGNEVQRVCALPLGINMLRNDAESALAVASAVGAQFVRVNVHTGVRVTDQGIIQGSAHETLRYRRFLGADVRIFADADVKHSAPVAARGLKIEIDELVSRGGADAVIVTGDATGGVTSLEDLRIAKAAAGQTPVLAGSGVDAGNVAAVLKIADAVIVGTAFKRDGLTTNPVDADRVRKIVEAVNK
jgi:membrane complex biogenesis BtpA family protein